MNIESEYIQEVIRMIPVRVMLGAEVFSKRQIEIECAIARQKELDYIADNPNESIVPYRIEAKRTAAYRRLIKAVDTEVRLTARHKSVIVLLSVEKG